MEGFRATEYRECVPDLSVKISNKTASRYSRPFNRFITALVQKILWNMQSLATCRLDMQINAVEGHQVEEPRVN